jgi:hypothetical protein
MASGAGAFVAECEDGYEVQHREHIDGVSFVSVLGRGMS